MEFVGEKDNRQKAAAKRSATKIKRCISILDDFKSKNDDRLPTIRHMMKVCKIGFISAHQVVKQYAIHCNCREEEIKAIMNVRSDAKKRNNLKKTINK